MPRLLLLCIAAGLVRLSSQFGNVQVQWDAAQPRVQTNEAVPASFKAPLNVRRSALHELPIEKLSEIFSGLRPGLTCNACTTTGHWISEIRAACLEASPKVSLRNHCALRDYVPSTADTVCALAGAQSWTAEARRAMRGLHDARALSRPLA